MRWMSKRKRQRKPGHRHALPNSASNESLPAGAPATGNGSSRSATKRVFGTIAVIAAVVAALFILVVGQIDFSSGSMTASAKPAHGKALYQQYCVGCHGFEGRGEFNWQNRERGAPALDSSGHAWHHEDAQLLGMILDKPAPDSKMPPWRGVLTREDALDIIAYMKTTWTPHIRDNCQGAKHMNCM